MNPLEAIHAGMSPILAILTLLGGLFVLIALVSCGDNDKGKAGGDASMLDQIPSWTKWLMVGGGILALAWAFASYLETIMRIFAH